MADRTTILDKNKPLKKVDHTDPNLLFSNTNYLLVFTGIIFIAVGFALMAGGGSKDPNVFDAEAIYSFRRITLAPIFVLIGFAIEIAAILKKP